MLHLRPTLEEFLALTGSGNVVPISAELLADTETPVSAYAKLRGDGPSFLLESVEGGEHVSRYSFIGCRARRIIRADPGSIDPLQVLEEIMRGHRAVELPGLPPFTGGAVGFLSYEYIHSIEPTVPLAAQDELGVPTLWFMLCDTLVVFDRARQTLRLISNAHLSPDVDPRQTYARAADEVEALHRILSQPAGLNPVALDPSSPRIDPPAGNFTREAFEACVEQSKEFIRSGDIFQLVLSQRFTRDYSGSPLDLYRALRTVNPSPYMFVLETGDLSLVGASPEVHVRLTADRVEIRPIAGTRPRGATPDADAALESDLLADEKEKAEHLMLVDLARNDIGRVCRHGTVQVREFMTIERYSHVMHIVSHVEGQLAPECSAFDLMRATFPAGTVTGAPKIRAMQLIADFEQTRRGAYAGALGYFSYNGNLDSCITLRTAVLKDHKVHVQAGAGIVADSVPAAEYQETINKASALFRAITLSRGI